MNPLPRQSAPACAIVEQALSRWFHDHGVLKTRLLVGVSGGPDSVALLRGLAACRSELTLDVVAAHLDHGLRPDSHKDAAWVSKLATALGFESVIERLGVAALDEQTGQGVEETARRLRYDFFLRAARKHECPYVAVGHTADDQAETVLHHLFRGTGLSGLRGMPQSRPLAPDVTLIRPLLNDSRAELHRYLSELNQPFRIDVTNDDEQFTRNRLRRTLLPLLKEQFNPQVVDALIRLSRQVEDVQEFVERLSGQLLEASLIERDPDHVRLDCRAMSHQPRHLVREALRLLWTEQDWPRQRMGFDDWDRLAALVQSPQSSKSLDVPARISARRHLEVVTLDRH